MPDEPEDLTEPIQYAVRLTDHALRDRAEAAVWIMDQVSEEAGHDWLKGLGVAIGTLATQPRRYAVQERESRLIGRETRRLLYQRTLGSAAYHLLYFIEDDSRDGPRVFVAHIRHAARRPLTAKEARGLRAN